VDGHGRLNGPGVRAVDAAGGVDGALHRGDQPPEQCGLLADEDPGIHIDVVGTLLLLVARNFGDAPGVLRFNELADRLAAGVDQFPYNQHFFLLCREI
jgi:hypothetical protein